MKKTTLLLVGLALMTTALVGCSSSSSNSQAQQTSGSQTSDKPSLALNTGGDSTSTSSGQSAQGQTQPQSDPKLEPAAIQAVQNELRSAFHIDASYLPESPLVITEIAEGSQNLQIQQLDQKHRLDLAKQLANATTEIGYQVNDNPPDIFLNPDGSSFAVGLKRANAQLLLNTYELQKDGTWKETKKQTAQGKPDSTTASKSSK